MKQFEAMKAVMLEIKDSLSRKKGNFGICRTPAGTNQPFNLSAGAPTAIRIDSGWVVSLGLSRERLIALRDQCNELLQVESDQ